MLFQLIKELSFKKVHFEFAEMLGEITTNIDQVEGIDMEVRGNDKGDFALTLDISPITNFSGFYVKSEMNIGWALYHTGYGGWANAQPKLRYQVGVDEFKDVDNTAGTGEPDTNEGAYILFNRENIQKQILENGGTDIFRLVISFDAASNEDKTIESIKLLQPNTAYLDRVANSYYKTPEQNPREVVAFDLLSPRLEINLDGETLYPALYTDHFEENRYAQTVITIGEPDDTNALAFRELLKDLAFEKEEGKL